MDRNRQGHYYHFMDILIAAKVIDRYTGPSVTPSVLLPGRVLELKPLHLGAGLMGKQRKNICIGNP